jgi:Cys-tRNA(Pro)/Cys-tRNA(Cys) deacylase
MPSSCPASSGYTVGGISPFGQIRNIRTATEEQAMPHDLVYINGGQRGLQVRLSPRDAARLLHAIVAPLVA